MDEVWPVVCGTAHRRLPNRVWVASELDGVAVKLRDRHGTRVGVSGMAIGGDLLWADTIDRTAGLELHAHVPFPQQPDRWTGPQRAEWRRLVDRAAHITVYGDLADVPEPASRRAATRLLHARNDGMLATSAACLAIWDPDAYPGGTWSAVNKALRQGLPVIHLDPARKTTTLPTPGRLAELLRRAPQPRRSPA